MQQGFKAVICLFLITAFGSVSAHAGKIALLLEQPYGHFGSMNPTGHVSIYLSDVCVETPVELRRCDPGERGAVISRYHRIDGYDWLAMPLLAYLYAVDDPDDIPDTASKKLAMQLRDNFRRAHLLNYVPNDPDGGIPDGDWTQLLGESYLRKIYGYSLETTPQQDDALIAMLNGEKNRSRYNLAFRNCADVAEDILNFYFPHSVHRNFIADLGFMTPKQTAHSFEKYAKRHPDLNFTTFIIPQVPGSIHRSSDIHGVLDSVLETPKYVLPLAILHPVVAGSLIAVYIGGGRYHPGAHIENVFDAQQEMEPGMGDASDRTVLASEKPTAERPAPNSTPAPETSESASAMTLQPTAFHPSE
jgi:hypothetical protein